MPLPGLKRLCMSVCLFVSVHWTDNWEETYDSLDDTKINIPGVLNYCRNIFWAHPSKINQT